MTKPAESPRSTCRIASAIVRDFETESQKTQKLLAAVPEDKFDWKPHEKSMSLRELAAHLAEAPTWLDSILDADEMDFARIEDSYRPFSPATHIELMEAFATNAKAFSAALEAREDDFMGCEWTMRRGEQLFMKAPREVVIRDIMIHHVAHHRGQLTVYLRLLDVAVPATYGSTADDDVFKN